MKTFVMKIDDKPDENMFPSDTEKSEVLQVAVKKMLTDFVDLSFPMKTKKRLRSMDYVHEYGKDALTMGLLYIEFKDAIREGDGERVLRCWKFMFLCFRATGITH